MAEDKKEPSALDKARKLNAQEEKPLAQKDMVEMDKTAQQLAKNYADNVARLKNSEAYKLLPQLLADSDLNAQYKKYKAIREPEHAYSDAQRKVDNLVYISAQEIEIIPEKLGNNIEWKKRLVGLGLDNPLSKALEKKSQELWPAINDAHDALEAAVNKKIKDAHNKNPKVETDPWFTKGVIIEYMDEKSDQSAALAAKAKPALPPYDVDEKVYGLVLDEKAAKAGKIHYGYSPADAERHKIYDRFNLAEAETAIWASKTIENGDPAKKEAAMQLFIMFSQHPGDDDREKIAHAKEIIEFIQKSDVLKSDPVIQQKTVPGLSMYASELKAHHEKYFPSQEQTKQQHEVDPAAEKQAPNPVKAKPLESKGMSIQ